tara:strand:+ start:1739 stop:2728 length:990 start_codon:yes stop_codon:yes gene_type:complete
MDPFTLAAITFGVQKLRGKSTNRALRDGIFAGGLGQLGGMAGVKGFSSFGSAGGMGGAGALAGEGIKGQFANTGVMQGIGSLFSGGGGQAANAARAGGADMGTVAASGGGSGGGFLSRFMPTSKAGQFGLATAALSLLGGGGDDEPRSYLAPIPNQAYSKFAKSGAAGTPTGFMVRDYTTGTDSALENPETYQTVEDILGSEPTQNFKSVNFNTGGLASIAKFNEGGLGQMLPSKHSHSEDDLNNYTRAGGFVKDGAGMGDENEDTMLAQLADGEFVSRSAAVRGAGIIAGADLNSKEDQRKKGAEFFYEQQKRFKRIMDILDASRKDN